MATNENLINIPGRLHSVATEGHVAGADEIYDDTETKLQSTINSEIRTEIGTDSTSGSIKGRVKTLEDAVGTGGSVDTRISAAINALDASASQTAGADGLALSVTEADGKVTAISGSIAANTYDAYGAAATAKSEILATKGVANGIASLGSDGKVPSTQLPSYVDDVIEGYYYNSKFYKEAAHTTEITGETGKIYVDLTTNDAYRWSGSVYVLISNPDVYTKSQTDALINAETTRAQGVEATKANVSDVTASLALKADKATTYTKTEVDTLIEDAAFLDDGDSSSVIADFDPQADTLWKKQQTLSSAEKAQVQANIGVTERLNAQDDKIEMLNGSEVIVGTLPASGTLNKIYRVPDDPTSGKYTDYGWDGTQFVALCTYPNDVDDEPTAGSDNLVKSGGVFLDRRVIYIVDAGTGSETAAQIGEYYINVNNNKLYLVKNRVTEYITSQEEISWDKSVIYSLYGSLYVYDSGMTDAIKLRPIQKVIELKAEGNAASVFQYVEKGDFYKHTNGNIYQVLVKGTSAIGAQRMIDYRTDTIYVFEKTIYQYVDGQLQNPEKLQEALKYTGDTALIINYVGGLSGVIAEGIGAGEIYLNVNDNNIYEIVQGSSGLTHKLYHNRTETYTYIISGQPFMYDGTSFIPIGIMSFKDIGTATTVSDVGLFDIYFNTNTNKFYLVTEYSGGTIGSQYQICNPEFNKTYLYKGKLVRWNGSQFVGNDNISGVLVVTGDSIPHGQIAQSPWNVNKPYPNIVAETLGMELKNYAIGGSTFAQSSDFGGTFCSYADFEAATKDTSKLYIVLTGRQTYDTYKYSGGAWETTSDMERTPVSSRFQFMDNDADVVLVHCGTNDFQYNWTSVGSMEDATASTPTPDTFYGAVAYTILGLLQKYLGKSIILCTPIKRAQSPYTLPTSVNELGKTLGDYCEIIKEVCAYYSIPVIDLYNESCLNPSLSSQSSLFDDIKTHPLQTGHDMLAKIVAGKVNSLYK